ncbi:hypothetical protein K2173_026191 [Erythroxylum novogranatense]|uniref:Cytochrome P450 n=1 Tax=Erythroxylum novogranatense TaxID=1862640 RepID=A0AAV8TAR0_9ROSI|nr:hypothetical protein K2173_026191 [Erythroxylum novogranatense]
MYRSLGDLCTKYGDVLLLRFGTHKVLVVSSPSAVKECFTKNDIIFSNRPRLIAGEHLHYNYRAIGFSSYGDHWRNLRRVTSMELFSTSRLNKFSIIRQEEVQLLLKKLFQESVDVKEMRVNLSSLFMELTFNIVLRMIAGNAHKQDRNLCDNHGLGNVTSSQQSEAMQKTVVDIEAVVEYDVGG